MVIYRAKEGDTIARIARQHGILPGRLCELNGITGDLPPIVGQALVIDAPSKSYYAKEGDTLRPKKRKDMDELVRFVTECDA